MNDRPMTAAATTTPLAINAAFDGGNIRLVRVDGDRIDLEIVKDRDSDYFQWFYFRVAGAAGRTLTYRILNAGSSAYPFGWPGYKARASTDRQAWRMIETRYADGVLEFDFTADTDLAWFAYFAPYTMEMHAALVARTNLPLRRTFVAAWSLLLFLPLYLQASAWDAGFGQQGWASILTHTVALPWLRGMGAAIWIHGLAATPWVMLIVGGSGNNWGAVLGGFLIWWLWVMVEPMGLWIMGAITSGMADGSWLKSHLQDSAAHMRLLTMGMILLLVLRFSPRGLIPEK